MLRTSPLGRFNGAYPDADPRVTTTGAQELPRYPWLRKGFLRGWIGFLEEQHFDEAVMAMRDEDQQAWEQPLVRRVVSERTRERLVAVWQARRRLLAAMQRLPRTLAHGDAHRRNLLSRQQGGRDVTVAVDWDVIGMAPLGEDPGHLVSTSLLVEVDPTQARELDSAVFAGYLEGLRNAGWRVDGQVHDLLRFGYAAHAALNMGVFGAGALVAAQTQEWLRLWLEDILDGQLETLARPMVVMSEFCFDLADEAFALGAQLGLFD